MATNYLNNKELLTEIHESKKSYSSYLDNEHANYVIIVDSHSDINVTNLALAKETRAGQITARLREELRHNPKAKAAVVPIDPQTIPDQDIVFRLMTYEHVPLDPTRKKKPKTVADRYVKINFPPYKHFIIVNAEVKEVGRSHWKGGIQNGFFCSDHGKPTRKLALMYMKIVERYSHRGQWHSYTYLDEMRSNALLQLSQIGLQFNEHRSNNPFAYYTTVIKNSFTRVVNLEKRQQVIRDDILIMSGESPSYTRQINDELAAKSGVEEYDNVHTNPAQTSRPGRRPAAPNERMKTYLEHGQHKVDKKR